MRKENIFLVGGKNDLELFSLFCGGGKVLVVLLQSADRGRS